MTLRHLREKAGRRVYEGGESVGKGGDVYISERVRGPGGSGFGERYQVQIRFTGR
jgi:hypothetical protein